MGNLQSFVFDNSTGLATVGAGMLVGGLNEQLWKAGQRCVPHAVSFSVGMGGHATIGGFGQLSRRAGLLSDHVVEAQVVLANASVVRTSAAHHPDLYFAIQGAGASFGIVTELVLETQVAPTSVISYTYSWVPTGDGAKDSITRAAITKAWQSLIYEPALPWALSSTLSLSATSAIVYGTYDGTRADFDALQLPRYFAASPPDKASVQAYRDNYRQLSVDWDDLLLQAVAASQGYFYAKSLLWTQPAPMADGDVDQLIRDMDQSNNQGSDGTTADLSLDFELLGGRMSTTPATATAFPHRNARFAMLLYARTMGPVPSATVHTLQALEDVAVASSLNSGGVSKIPNGRYAGFVEPKLEAEEARRAYWGPNLERLSAIKAGLDPQDVFHNPQSVRPEKRVEHM